MESLTVSSLRPEALTWEQAWRFFELRCKAQNLSPTTVELYGYAFRSLRGFLTAHGNPKPAEVRTHDVRAFLEDCRSRLASETVDARYRQARTLFGFLRRDGVLFHDPTEGVERPKRERRLLKPFNVEDFQKVLSQINVRRPLGLRDRALFLLLADSGMRISEALSLAIASLDFGTNTALALPSMASQIKSGQGQGCGSLRSARQVLLKPLRLLRGC